MGAKSTISNAACCEPVDNLLAIGHEGRQLKLRLRQESYQFIFIQKLKIDEIRAIRVLQ